MCVCVCVWERERERERERETEGQCCEKQDTKYNMWTNVFIYDKQTLLLLIIDLTYFSGYDSVC